MMEMKDRGAAPESRKRCNGGETDDLAEIDLLGLMMAVLRRWKLCAGIVLAVVAAGLAYCFLVPTSYQTTARVFVDTATLKTTPKDEAQLVLTSDVLTAARRDAALPEDAEPMATFRSRFVVKEVPKSSLVEITYQEADAVRAAKVTQATADAYVREIQARMEAVKAQNEKNKVEAVNAPWGMTAPQLQPVAPFIAVPASADFAKATPPKMKIMAVLVLASLVLSVLICVVLELLDRTVKTRGEFERASGLAVLEDFGDKRRQGTEKEAWRRVSLLCDVDYGEGCRVLIVAAPSAVKTTVSAAAELAATFADNGRRVLLAEVGGSSLPSAKRGGVTTMAVAAGAKARQQIEEQLANFDTAILAVPPLSESAEALSLATLSNAKFLLVGKVRSTEREALRQTVAMVDQVGCDIAGAVLVK